MRIAHQQSLGRLENMADAVAVDGGSGGDGGDGVGSGGGATEDGGGRNVVGQQQDPVAAAEEAKKARNEDSESAEEEEDEEDDDDESGGNLATAPALRFGEHTTALLCRYAKPKRDLTYGEMCAVRTRLSFYLCACVSFCLRC